ncbi:MAG: wax ester/triacylglycerol synthase family O-acyltransferase [Aquimonas sp.]|nr:wax ester/triacylglycerol synthase family O-acyltransferase [Aquimonas sp.]
MTDSGVKQERDAPRRETMSKVDTAWLRMERPTNLMMITGVMMFAEPLELAALKKLIAERWLAFRRFRQKAVDASTGAHWEDDADFDLDWHVRLTALPGRADKAALEHLVSLLASTGLDHSKPLWQFHLVERYNGGSAVIARIHHCYADGIALVQVLLSLTDVSREPRPGADLPRAWLKDDGHKITKRFFDPAVEQFDRAMKMGGKMMEKSLEMYRDPGLAAVLAKEGGEIARELGQVLMLPDDPDTPLKAGLGVSKRCAWAPPLPLEEVKTIARALGCTVNDVLLAAAAGALRGYLLDQGFEPNGCGIRATVPVNLRPLEHAKKLGNHFGLVFLDLPIHEPNPLRRLQHVAGNMRHIKSSRQAIMTFGVLAALGMAPPAVQKRALELFSKKGTVVATNVPGPQLPLYMAGAQISELMFWVPQSGSIGIGISILSYNDRVHFGLISDAKCIARPQDVIDRFAPEFEKLLLATMLEDWNAPILPEDSEDTLRRLVCRA